MVTSQCNCVHYKYHATVTTLFRPQNEPIRAILNRSQTYLGLRWRSPLSGAQHCVSGWLCVART